MPFYSLTVTFNGNLYLPLAGGTMSGGIAVNANNTLDLGASGTAWRTLFAHNVDSPAALKIGPTTATSVELGRAGQTLQVNANVSPSGNNTLNIGTGTAVFASVFTRALTSDAALAIDGAGALTVGPTSATSLALGRAAITTTINGLLRYDNTGGALGASAGTLLINVGGVNRLLEFFAV